LASDPLPVALQEHLCFTCGSATYDLSSWVPSLPPRLILRRSTHICTHFHFPDVPGPLFSEQLRKIHVMLSLPLLQRELTRDLRGSHLSTPPFSFMEAFLLEPPIPSVLVTHPTSGRYEPFRQAFFFPLVFGPHCSYPFSHWEEHDCLL